MLHQQRQTNEYHLLILQVKMMVKFPCRMIIEHLNSPITEESLPQTDNRFMFHQEVVLNSEHAEQYFQFGVNLLTDKGAKYAAGNVKLYLAQLYRSQGEVLTLSLYKCLDKQAVCEVKVQKIISAKKQQHNKKDPQYRNQSFQNIQMRQTFSPAQINSKIIQSRSEYHFSDHIQKSRNPWEMKSGSKVTTNPIFHSSKITIPRVNLTLPRPVDLNQKKLTIQALNREKSIEADVYKQGYQKLKQKVKQSNQMNKQELAMRAVRQNNQNNLKIQVMRLKLRVLEQSQSITDKQHLIKQQQSQIASLQQKQAESRYMREQINRKDTNIQKQEERIDILTNEMEQLKNLASKHNTELEHRVRQLQSLIKCANQKLQTQWKQSQRQLSKKLTIIHQKQLEIASYEGSLEREKQNVHELQKAWHNKQFQLQKQLMNQRANSKAMNEEIKSQNQKLEKSSFENTQEIKNQHREIQQLKSNVIKNQYEKKMLIQQLQLIKPEYSALKIEIKVCQQKYNELSIQHKLTQDQYFQLQKQFQREINIKQKNIFEISKQFQEQIDNHRRVTKDLDERMKYFSNKVVELQGQLEISKSQQDKIRNNLQHTIKEATEAKQREKATRKALKAKEQQSNGIEHEITVVKQKFKNIDQIGQLEVQKFREQAFRSRSQLQNELQKNEKLFEKYTQLTNQHNKLKVKFQYSQEYNLKELAKLKQQLVQIQNQLKNDKQEIQILNQNISKVKVVEKQQSSRLGKYELEIVRLEQQVARFTRDFKIIQQKCNCYEKTQATNMIEIQALQIQKQNLLRQYAQVEDIFQQFKTDYEQITGERNRLLKGLQLQQEQTRRAKMQITSLNQKIIEIEKTPSKSEQQLQKKLKQETDKFVKMQTHLVSYKKQIQRYRQELVDTIHKYISSLPIRNKQQNSKNIQSLLSNKPIKNTFSQSCTLLASQSKEIKQVLMKQSDQIKVLHKENQQLRQSLSVATYSYQNLEIILKKQRGQSQKQINRITQEKLDEDTYLNRLITELNAKIAQYESQQYQLYSQIQELNYTLSNYRQAFENSNQQNSKKITNLIKLNSELEEKIELHLLTITELDQRNSAVQNQVNNLEMALRNENQRNNKYTVIFKQLEGIKQDQALTIVDLKRYKCNASSQISQLELQLSNYREINQKLTQNSLGQQLKVCQLHSLISSLMKQKQKAISSSLQKDQSIITLELALAEAKRQHQFEREQNKININSYELQREQNKQMNNKIKQLQLEKIDGRLLFERIQQKLKQKTMQLVKKEQQIKIIELKNQKIIQKYKLDLRGLEEEIDAKNNSILLSAKDKFDKIMALEDQIKRKQSIVSSVESKLALQQQVINQNQEELSSQQQTILSLMNENEGLKVKLNQLEFRLNGIFEQCKQKEEKLYQYAGTIFTLQTLIESKQRQKSEALQHLNNDWLNKCEGMCEQYEQKIELLEKDQNYERGLAQEMKRENNELTDKVKNIQISQQLLKKSCEEQIAKLQQQKLTISSIKNTENQRLIEQVKMLSESLRQKQLGLIKTINQLQIRRKSINYLENKLKQYDEKMKNLNKNYQIELQQLKKKQSISKSYKQTVNSFIWTVQREIKKSLQGLMTNYLEIGGANNSQRIIELFHSKQKEIIQIFNTKSKII